MPASQPPASPLPLAPSLSYGLALAVAYVISPLILPPIFFGLALVHVGATASEVTRAVGLGVVFFALVPLGYVVWMVRTGRARSLDIRDRSRRTTPFLVGVASYAVALGIVAGLGGTGSALLVAVIACHIVNTLVLTTITSRWKISIHSTAIAGFVVMLAFVRQIEWPASTGFLTPTLVLACALLIPLVMWARVHARVHSWAQVMAGMAFGLVVPYAELYLVYRLGWLGL